MILSARHTVRIAECPADFVVREPSFIEERQWASAHDRAAEAQAFSDMIEVDAEFVARCLVRIEGEEDTGERAVIRAPFTGDQVRELLTGRAIVALAAEVQTAGRPKPRPSPSGDDTQT